MLVDRQLYGVPLRVPRCFFVDSTLEPEAAAEALARGSAAVSRVKRTPPGGSSPRHLYKVRTRIALWHIIAAPYSHAIGW